MNALDIENVGRSLEMSDSNHNPRCKNVSTRVGLEKPECDKHWRRCTIDTEKHTNTKTCKYY